MCDGQAQAKLKTITPFQKKSAGSKKVLSMVTVRGKVSPEAIAMKIDGDCLHPRARHGQLAIVENKLPEPGDLAVFWFKEHERPIVKVLRHKIYGWPHNPRSNVTMPIEFDQFNPPKRMNQTGGR
jgi:hypothetical protein